MKKSIFILGTDCNGQGGIASVFQIYKESTLPEKWPIVFLSTHKAGSLYSKFFIFLKSFFILISSVFKKEICFAHIHVASRASFFRKSIFFWFLKFFGVPSILHVHGAEFMVFYEKESGFLVRKFIKKTFDKCCAIVVLSESWASNIKSITSNRTIVVINNPVNIPSKVDHDAREPFLILFLGRIGQRKGAFDLIKAVAQIKNEFSGIRLFMGGDGDIEEAKNLALNLGVSEQIQFPGWVSGFEKDKFFRAATVYALPSYNEGLPVGILEAMAYGLPVVTTPVGGIPEIIVNGVNGILCEPGNIECLSNSFRVLFGNQKLVDDISKINRNKAILLFSSEKVVDKIDKLYREILMNGCIN